MSKLAKLIVLFLIPAFVAIQSTGAEPDSLSDLVQVEREFSRTSEAKGIKEAFLTFMSDAAVLFRPGPVNGKEWMEARPAPTALLTWEPVFADISAAGDLGYTTGPYKLQPKSGDRQTVSHGNYMTIWRKETNGTWRFVIDFGTRNPAPTGAASSSRFPRTTQRARIGSETELERARAALMKLDWNLSALSEKRGTAKAFSQYADQSIRLMRTGNFPVLGKQNAVAMLAKNADNVTCQPSRAYVAASVDLGYSWGSYQSRPPESAGDKATTRGHYVRIWKRSGSAAWKIVLDVMNPVTE